VGIGVGTSSLLSYATTAGMGFLAQSLTPTAPQSGNTGMFGPLQRDYIWQIGLDDVSGISGKDTAKYCQAVSVGPFDASAKYIKYGPRRLAMPDQLSIGNVTLMFLSPIPNIVSAYFTAWFNMMVDQDGYYSPMMVYKRNVPILLMADTKNEKQTVGRLTLKGAFVLKRPRWDLKYSGEGGVVMHGVELSVDNLSVEMANWRV
jgi:hypothetical protein